MRALRSTFALLMLAAGASACAVKPSAMNLPAAGPLVSDEASPPAPAVDGSDLVPIPLTLAELVDSPILPDTIGTDSLLDGGETPDGVLALAGGEDGDQAVVGIDIPLNNRVLAYVQSFTGRLRTHVQDALARGAQYLPMIKDVFRAEGLPLELAYIPIVESAFQPDAVSRALATGLWQFMGPTARENGLVHDWYMDERSEPFKATVAAARYLKALYATFGDWHLALASYNGGPGRVQRAMKRSGRTDFWSLSASSRFLPRETRNYVPLILAAAIIGRDPLQYGFDVPEVPDQAPPTDTIALAGPVDLDRIAEWIDVPVDTLRALNPSLRRWTTPVRPGIFELRVPRDTRPLIQVRLAEADPSDLTSLGWYTVNRGDTLTSVAKTLGVRRLDLAEANYLSLRARLAPGQQLIVPRAPGAAAAAPDPEPATSARVTYRVRRGDTLSTIARRHGISVASLRRWNDLRGSLIRAGDRLTIYTNRTAAD